MSFNRTPEAAEVLTRRVRLAHQAMNNPGKGWVVTPDPSTEYYRLIYPHVDLTQSYAMISLYVDNYNQDIERRRQLIDDPDERRKLQPLKRGHVQLMQLLVRNFGAHLHHLDRNNLSPDTQYTVTRAAAAASLKCNSSTVWRNIKRLTEAGLVLDREFHGSNKACSYTLNPLVVRVRWTFPMAEAQMERLGLQEDAQRPEPDHLMFLAPFMPLSAEAQAVVAKCTHIEPRTLDKEKIKKLSGFVDNVSSLRSNRCHESFGQFSRKQGEADQPTPQNPPLAHHEPSESTAPARTGLAASEDPSLSQALKRAQEGWPSTGAFEAAERRAELAAQRAAESDENGHWRALIAEDEPLKLSPERLHLVDRLAGYAKRLWPQKRWLPLELTIVNRYIGRWIEALPQVGTEALETEFRGRIDLVQGWLKKRADRYVGEPMWYFRPDNPHGYHGTAPWYADRKTYEKRRATASANAGWLANAIEQYRAQPTLKSFTELQAKAKARPDGMLVHATLGRLVADVKTVPSEQWQEHVRAALSAFKLRTLGYVRKASSVEPTAVDSTQGFGLEDYQRAMVAVRAEQATQQIRLAQQAKYDKQAAKIERDTDRRRMTAKRSGGEHSIAKLV
jgi:hypothetical protein